MVTTNLTSGHPRPVNRLLFVSQQPIELQNIVAPIFGVARRALFIGHDKFDLRSPWAGEQAVFFSATILKLQITALVYVTALKTNLESTLLKMISIYVIDPSSCHKL